LYKIGEGCADTKAPLDVILALEELTEDSAREIGVASESGSSSGVAK